MLLIETIYLLFLLVFLPLLGYWAHRRNTRYRSNPLLNLSSSLHLDSSPTGTLFRGHQMVGQLDDRDVDFRLRNHRLRGKIWLALEWEGTELQSSPDFLKADLSGPAADSRAQQILLRLQQQNREVQISEGYLIVLRDLSETDDLEPQISAFVEELRDAAAKLTDPQILDHNKDSVTLPQSRESHEVEEPHQVEEESLPRW